MARAELHRENPENNLFQSILAEIYVGLTDDASRLPKELASNYEEWNLSSRRSQFAHPFNKIKSTVITEPASKRPKIEFSEAVSETTG